jgi:hypothetical protein
MSEISNTDALLFKKLANPEVVNLEIVDRHRRRRTPVVQAMMEKAMREGVEGDDPREPMEQREPEREGSDAAAGERRSGSRKRARDEDETSETDKRHRDDEPRLSCSPEEERMEKQGLLIELQALEARGVKLTRAFTMDNSVAELEFEISKHAACHATRNGVAFLRDALKLVVTGIDLGNAKLGPFLSIDGWAESVTSDIGRYDHTLERIYKRYWRRQQVNPIVELAGLLIGSMITWHFRSKFIGNAEASAGPVRRSPERTAEPRATAQEEPRRSRPTLKPPAGGLFSRVF